MNSLKFYLLKYTSSTKTKTNTFTQPTIDHSILKDTNSHQLEENLEQLQYNSEAMTNTQDRYEVWNSRKVVTTPL